MAKHHSRGESAEATSNMSSKIPDRNSMTSILDGSPDLPEKDSDPSQPLNSAVRPNHYDGGIFASVEDPFTADSHHTVVPPEKEEFVPPENYGDQTCEPCSRQHQVFRTGSMIGLVVGAQHWQPLTVLDDPPSQWYQDLDHLFDGRKQPLIPRIQVQLHSMSIFHAETTSSYFPLPLMNELEPVAGPQDPHHCPLSLVLTGRGSTPRCKEKFQLKRWVYETGNASLTFAEKMEKSNWENGRLEKL